MKTSRSAFPITTGLLAAALAFSLIARAEDEKADSKEKADAKAKEGATIAQKGPAEESPVLARARAVQKEAQAKYTESKDADAAFGVLEKGARDMLKEFPGKPEPYQLLMAVAMQGSSDTAHRIAEELSKGDAPDEIKTQAKTILKKFEALGKPLDVKFTAIDGREVNVQDMKGKVVLIDFWATWCGPCVGEIPHVKEAYEKLHPKGFEIVGLSFDQDKSALENFVKAKEMPWPQYFDGEGWGNKFGKEFGINSIPAMWLVDKKGVLREQNARGDLQGKVEKLLAE